MPSFLGDDLFTSLLFIIDRYGHLHVAPLILNRESPVRVGVKQATFAFDCDAGFLLDGGHALIGVLHFLIRQYS